MSLGSIQSLREKRADLGAQARTLLNDNKGDKFTSEIKSKLGDIYEDMTELDRQIHNHQVTIEAGAHQPAAAEQWRNPETGAAITVLGKEHAGRINDVLKREMQDGTLADFFRAVAGGNAPSAIKNALSVGTDGSGGFAVPSWLFSEFIESLIPNTSVLQAGARIVPLPGTAKSFRLARVNGIPSASWRAESAAVVESDPSFTALDLTPKSLAFYFKCSRELLQDSANITTMLAHAISQAFSKELDRTALRGAGTATEPYGVLNTAGIAAVANGANGALLSAIKWTNINSAYQSILDANAPTPTSVIMAPRTLVGFSGLADTTGQPLRRPGLLEPMAFIPTSAIPVNLTVGSSTDCTELYVGDFRELVIGMREDVSVMLAPQPFATTGQVAFVCHMRADIGVLHAASFAKITGVRPG